MSLSYHEISLLMIDTKYFRTYPECTAHQSSQQRRRSVTTLTIEDKAVHDQGMQDDHDDGHVEGEGRQR
jgi:hypothetical protein